MRFARSCLAGFFFSAFALGSLVLGFLLFPALALSGNGSAARRRMRRLVRVTYRFFVWAARTTGLFRVEMSRADGERLASLKGHVIVANHISLIDIIILIAHLGDSTAIAKAAAARNPFYSRIVRAAFLVNDNPETVLDEAAKILAEGVNLIVFPEGTRMSPGAADRRLRRGAAQIALAADAPILPIVISCDPPVLGKGQPWHDVGARTITYTLAVGEKIAAQPASVRSHAAASELTARIGRSLFGG